MTKARRAMPGWPSARRSPMHRHRLEVLESYELIGSRSSRRPGWPTSLGPAGGAALRRHPLPNGPAQGLWRRCSELARRSPSRRRRAPLRLELAGPVRQAPAFGSGFFGKSIAVVGPALAALGRQLVHQRDGAGVVVAGPGLDRRRRRSCGCMISRPRSVRTMVSVQSLYLPMPPVEMSACSAAKSGQCLQPSRVQAWHSLRWISW